MGVAKRSHSLYRAALRKRVAEGQQEGIGHFDNFALL